MLSNGIRSSPESARLRRCSADGGLRREPDVLVHAEQWEDARHLEGPAEALACAKGDRLLRDVTPAEVDRARRRTIEARQQIEERRLSGAVRPDDPEQLALCNLDRFFGQTFCIGVRRSLRRISVSVFRIRILADARHARASGRGADVERSREQLGSRANVRRARLLAPYLVVYSLLRVLGHIVSLDVAGEMVLVGYALGLPLAVAYALRSFGRDARLSLLAFALIFNRQFVLGFLSSLFAIPLFIFIIGLLKRYLDSPLSVEK